MHNPPIVFLDEPTSGVDPGTRRNFWDLIYQLSDGGVTIFVTTHYMEEAEYCNRIGLIDRGRLIAVGSPAELKSRHLKGNIYEVETSDLLKGMESFQGAERVLDTAVFGRALHVRLDEKTDAESYLPPILSEAGLETGKIKRIVPTLEDVFVALVGRDLSDQSEAT